MRKRWVAVPVSVGLTLLVRAVDAQQLAARVHADRAPDSIRVVASGQYQAGGFHRLILGDGYRDVWAAPLRVPVLDLDKVAGGLRSWGGRSPCEDTTTTDSPEMRQRMPVRISGSCLPGLLGRSRESSAC